MSRSYYSLITRTAGRWAVQFGDYDRDVVAEEADAVAYSEDLKKADVRIIRTGAKQADILAAVAKLNEKAEAAAAVSSAVIYRGPSLIDGAPIVAVAVVQSGNSKTGNMVQTYIIREDIAPVAASKSGADYSICGDCPHRGTPTTDPDRKQAIGRACYVVLGQGPTIVYKTLVRGGYRDALGGDAIRKIGAGRMVRLGTYGDPAAVPAQVWRDLVADAQGHTAYSHQASKAGAAFDPDLMMQSADNLAEAQNAWSLGRRTFRIVADVAAVVRGREILCPASEEAGKRTTCEKCGLCGGAAVAARSIAIVAHGAGAVNFVQ